MQIKSILTTIAFVATATVANAWGDPQKPAGFYNCSSCGTNVVAQTTYGPQTLQQWRIAPYANTTGGISRTSPGGKKIMDAYGKGLIPRPSFSANGNNIIRYRATSGSLKGKLIWTRSVFVGAGSTVNGVGSYTYDNSGDLRPVGYFLSNGATECGAKAFAAFPGWENDAALTAWLAGVPAGCLN